MEIDILSPRLPMRAVSSKRPRSPGSPSPLERAPKRPMVTPRESMSQLSWNIRLPQESGQGPGRSLYDEDWVKQTRGLKIHSPVIGRGELQQDVGNNSSINTNRGDVQMNGHEETISSSFAPHTLPVATHLPNSEGSNMVAQTAPYSPFRSLHAVQPQPIEPLTPNGSHNSAITFLDTQVYHTAPNIILQPATPSEGTRYILTPSRPPSPPSYQRSSSPMSMVVENCPLSPRTQWKIAAQSKKHSVSMGPRADCEKCRLKIPGHWMHFD